MSTPALRRRRLVAGMLIAAGAVAVVVAVLAELGLALYVCGVVAIAAGVVLSLIRRERVVLRSAIAVCVVAALGAVATVAVTGLPSSYASWPDDRDADLSATLGRVGGILYLDGTAYDVTTGDVLWRTGDDDQLVMISPEQVVIAHEIDYRHSQLRSHNLATGDVAWSVDTEPRVLGIAYDEHTLVTAQDRRTIAYNLHTGRQRWQAERQAAMECDLGRAANRFEPAREQAAVLVAETSDEDESANDAELRRVSDGKVLATNVACGVTARVVGDVLVEFDENHVLGTSTATGEQRWRTELPNGTPVWAFSGSGDTVFLGNDEVPEHYHALDVHTGRLARLEPPPSVETVDDDADSSRATQVWVPVTTETGPALWRLGTRRLVPVPSTSDLSLADVDPSGWLAVEGETTDIVGDEHDASWALSPEGELHGPLPGGHAYAGPGLITSGFATYPLFP